jgi:hypothetical protein
MLNPTRTTERLTCPNRPLLNGVAAPELPDGWTPTGDGGLALHGMHALDVFAVLQGDKICIGDSRGVAYTLDADTPDHWEGSYATWAMHMTFEDGLLPFVPEDQIPTFMDLLDALGEMHLDRDRFPDAETVAEHLDPGLTPELRKLTQHMRTYMHMPDTDDVLAVLGAGVAHVMTQYDPLWLMLVSVSSSGKGERLRQLDNVADYVLSDVTLAGLLSNRGSGGVLSQFPNGNALIIMRDFSTLLGDSKMSGNQKTDVFNALREIYDGEFSRDLNPEPVRWKGRISFVAACTPAIDRFTEHADALGTRWLYFRQEARDRGERKNAARMVFDRKGLTAKRTETMGIAAEIIHAGREAIGQTDLPPEFEDAIIDTATLVGYGRASVPREWGNRGEIDDIVTAEEPGRMIGQLKSLALGLLALGVSEDRVLRVVHRCATSSMPQTRARTLAVVASSAEPVSTYYVRTRSGLETKPCKRALEDWAAVGVLENGKDDDGLHDAWIVSEEWSDHVDSVYGTSGTGRQKYRREREREEVLSTATTSPVAL